MINLPEPGYTPANLRALLQHAGLTQQAAADMLGVDVRAVRRWCAPLTGDHADMPYYRWLQFVALVNKL